MIRCLCKHLSYDPVLLVSQSILHHTRLVVVGQHNKFVKSSMLRLHVMKMTMANEDRFYLTGSQQRFDVSFPFKKHQASWPRCYAHYTLLRLFSHENLELFILNVIVPMAARTNPCSLLVVMKCMHRALVRSLRRPSNCSDLVYARSNRSHPITFRWRRRR